MVLVVVATSFVSAPNLRTKYKMVQVFGRAGNRGIDPAAAADAAW